MGNKKIVIVAALSENRVIGRGGKLPWYLPNDMAHFKGLTSGETVIMGRKTLESIGRLLPGRRNIVVTRNSKYRNIKGLEVAYHPIDSLDVAFRPGHHEPVFVVGGGQIYLYFLGLATHMALTHVHTVIPDGDTFFPEVDWSKWKELHKQHYPAENGRFAHTIVHYERV